MAWGDRSQPDAIRLINIANCRGSIGRLKFTSGWAFLHGCARQKHFRPKSHPNLTFGSLYQVSCDLRELRDRVMSVIYKCESCHEETVVEQFVPGASLKCIHCGLERPSGMNGASLWWMDEPLTTATQSGASNDNSSDAEDDA